MSEEQILNAITNYCQDDNIVFQIITQDTKLYIYINRETEDSIDYKNLKNNVLSAISNLDNLDIREVYLYSRISRNIEPDWQITFDLKPSNLDETIDYKQDNTESGIKRIDNKLDFEVPNSFANRDRNEAKKISAFDLPYESQVLQNYEISSDIDDDSKENKILAETEIDLKSYCFIRNQTLLSSELIAPKFNIAQLTKTFHEFARSVKEKQLPILNDYFQKSCNPSTANFNPEVKLWWDKILELSSEEQRKTAIWLSRYCFNSEETLSIIESVFITKASIEKAKKETPEEENIHSSTEYSQKLLKQDERVSPSNSRNKDDNTNRNLKAKSKKGASSKKKLLVPIIWLFLTLSFAIIDLHKPLISLPVACENIAAENQAYCSLAAKIVGEESLNAVINNLPEPLKEEENLVPESMMQKGLLNCELYGNIAAGVPFKEAASSKIAPLSSSTKEILPDFYVADVEQTNLKAGNPTVRTACFFYKVKKTSKPDDIKFLAMDQIDVEWPTVAYEPTEKIKSLHTLNKTVRTYSFLSIFGIHTFFTAIAIYLIAISGMAIRVDSLDTLYQASFILGMTKSILSFFPAIGLSILVPMECLALGITSGCVKGFTIDWISGYPFVAVTALLLIALRTLFSFLFMGLLSFVFG